MMSVFEVNLKIGIQSQRLSDNCRTKAFEGRLFLQLKAYLLNWALRQFNENLIYIHLVNVSIRGAIDGLNMGQEMLIGDLATTLG